MPTLPRYERHVIYSGGQSERTICVVGDLNGDGVPEIVIGARRPRAEVYWLGRTGRGNWEAHLMDDSCGTLEAGGVLVDLDGDGDLDFIAGYDSRMDRICWWECPDDPAGPWMRREIFQMPANQTHDQLSADIDGDGRPELYFWNQKSKTLYTVKIPDDPKMSPWPGVKPVVVDVGEEGLTAADLDGDGRLELIAGQSWYRPLPDGTWERHEFARGYVSPRLAAADFDGDGRPEIVLSEGDASIYRGNYGRLVRFKAGADMDSLWEPEPLHDRLSDPHTLQVGDFDGDGHLDLLVAELGDPNGAHSHPPTIRIYQNRDGQLYEHIIDQGIGVHEGKVIELDGRLGLVGKPYRNVRDGVPRDRGVDSIHLWLPVENG